MAPNLVVRSESWLELTSLASDHNGVWPVWPPVGNGTKQQQPTSYHRASGAHNNHRHSTGNCHHPNYQQPANQEHLPQQRAIDTRAGEHLLIRLRQQSYLNRSSATLSQSSLSNSIDLNATSLGGGNNLAATNHQMRGQPPDANHHHHHQASYQNPTASKPLKLKRESRRLKSLKDKLDLHRRNQPVRDGNQQQQHHSSASLLSSSASPLMRSWSSLSERINGKFSHLRRSWKHFLYNYNHSAKATTNSNNHADEDDDDDVMTTSNSSQETDQQASKLSSHTVGQLNGLLPDDERQWLQMHELLRRRLTSEWIQRHHDHCQPQQQQRGVSSPPSQRPKSVQISPSPARSLVDVDGQRRCNEFSPISRRRLPPASRQQHQRDEESERRSVVASSPPVTRDSLSSSTTLVSSNRLPNNDDDDDQQQATTRSYDCSSLSSNSTLNSESLCLSKSWEHHQASSVNNISTTSSQPAAAAAAASRLAPAAGGDRRQTPPPKEHYQQHTTSQPLLPTSDYWSSVTTTTTTTTTTGSSDYYARQQQRRRAQQVEQTAGVHQPSMLAGAGRPASGLPILVSDQDYYFDVAQAAFAPDADDQHQQQQQLMINPQMGAGLRQQHGRPLPNGAPVPVDGPALVAAPSASGSPIAGGPNQPFVPFSYTHMNQHQLQHQLQAAAAAAAEEEDYEDYAVPSDESCRLDRSQVELVQMIGEGQKGYVFLGKLQSKDGRSISDVAIKTLKYETDQLIAKLMREAAMMRQFEHPHIIRFIGVCPETPALIAMELAEFGELKQYLKLNKHLISVSQLVLFTFQLSTALSYLESKQFVHRDVAARNVLVCSPTCVKLADFGLSRSLQQQQQPPQELLQSYNCGSRWQLVGQPHGGFHHLGPEPDDSAASAATSEDPKSLYMGASRGKLPVRWLAPESLAFRRFTSASDVWMFAVCGWEMFHFGQLRPWAHIRNNQVLLAIEAGQRLAKPPDCPARLYQLMLQCWSYAPIQRPKFRELKQSLWSIYLNERAREQMELEQQQQQQQQQHQQQQQQQQRLYAAALNRQRLQADQERLALLASAGSGQHQPPSQQPPASHRHQLLLESTTQPLQLQPQHYHHNHQTRQHLSASPMAAGAAPGGGGGNASGYSSTTATTGEHSNNSSRSSSIGSLARRKAAAAAAAAQIWSRCGRPAGEHKQQQQQRPSPGPPNTAAPLPPPPMKSGGREQHQLDMQSPLVRQTFVARPLEAGDGDDDETTTTKKVNRQTDEETEAAEERERQRRRKIDANLRRFQRTPGHVLQKQRSQGSIANSGAQVANNDKLFGGRPFIYDDHQLLLSESRRRQQRQRPISGGLLEIRLAASSGNALDCDGDDDDEDDDDDDSSAGSTEATAAASNLGAQFGRMNLICEGQRQQHYRHYRPQLRPQSQPQPAHQNQRHSQLGGLGGAHHLRPDISGEPAYEGLAGAESRGGGEVAMIRRSGPVEPTVLIERPLGSRRVGGGGGGGTGSPQSQRPPANGLAAARGQPASNPNGNETAVEAALKAVRAPMKAKLSYSGRQASAAAGVRRGSPQVVELERVAPAATAEQEQQQRAAIEEQQRQLAVHQRLLGHIRSSPPAGSRAAREPQRRSMNLTATTAAATEQQRQAAAATFRGETTVVDQSLQLLESLIADDRQTIGSKNDRDTNNNNNSTSISSNHQQHHRLRGAGKVRREL